MKIIAIEHERPGATAERFALFAEEEARALHDLYQRGLVREMHFRADRDAAVLVLEAPDMATAEGALSDLPYVENGLIEFERIPLRPYPGFERLFAEG